MRLFGGWLPFIGFREEELDDELRRFLHLDSTHKTVNTFQIGWFGVSLCIPIAPDEE